VARPQTSRYRGELLPHDLYEIWAQEPQEATRSTMLDLLDLCAAAAAVGGGDLDEARRIVERIVELAPEEDERCRKTASVLLEHGSKGAALSVLHRPRFTVSKVGVDTSPELLALERSLAA
jgi:DNA-binding SARP family transcriptional activator